MPAAVFRERATIVPWVRGQVGMVAPPREALACSQPSRISFCPTYMAGSTNGPTFTTTRCRRCREELEEEGVEQEQEQGVPPNNRPPLTTSLDPRPQIRRHLLRRSTEERRPPPTSCTISSTKEPPSPELPQRRQPPRPRRRPCPLSSSRVSRAVH